MPTLGMSINVLGKHCGYLLDLHRKNASMKRLSNIGISAKHWRAKQTVNQTIDVEIANQAVLIMEVLAVQAEFGKYMGLGSADLEMIGISNIGSAAERVAVYRTTSAHIELVQGAPS